LALVVVALAAAALGGVLAAQRAARNEHLAALRAHLDTCRQAGNALASPWLQLPPEDRLVVGRALLDEPGLRWSGSLHAAAATVVLVAVLQDDGAAVRRARAAHALGDLAAGTPLPVTRTLPLPVALDPAWSALNAAQVQDSSALVRTACAAALLRLRPVIRAYGLPASP
jgi:hypothetical protein